MTFMQETIIADAQSRVSKTPVGPHVKSAERCKADGNNAVALFGAHLCRSLTMQFPSYLVSRIAGFKVHITIKSHHLAAQHHASADSRPCCC